MAETALTRFSDSDEFLRRVMHEDHFKRGLLFWRAFKDKDPRMSWTFRDERLRSEMAVQAYHKYWNDRTGVTLAAILRFSYHGLTVRIEPPLEPRHDPEPDDPRYGHLHCSTEAARDKAHMEQLAKLVNDGEHAGIAHRAV